jgi:hypothetical protein
MAKPKQVAGFLKGGVIRQFMNIDAAVRQYALIPVDVTDARGCGHHPFQTFWRLRRCGHNLRGSLDDFVAGPREE